MSAPQFQSGEVGNVDETTVVITFDQAVMLEENTKAMTVARYGDAIVPSGGIARPSMGASRGRG